MIPLQPSNWEFIHHKNPVRWLPILFKFHKWEEWNTGRWDRLLRNTAGIWDKNPGKEMTEHTVLIPVVYVQIFSSVQFSRSVVSDSLWPHGLQHTRPPYPSPTPGVYSNSCPLSWWCHPIISSSVISFFSCLQSFPASGAFQMSQLFPSCGQSIGVSASASELPMNTQDWSPLGWTGWISLQSKGFSKVFSNTTVQKHQFFCTQLSL